MMNYIPKPIDTKNVELPEDLNELREAIAENAHEVWAVKRQSEGWTFGPSRDDNKKETPDMVPYSKLSDEEKEYDREMALNTLRLVRKLGYDIIKREETDLYKELLVRIRNSKQEFFCPQCHSEGKKTPIGMHQIFCHVCGHRLNIDWTLYKEKPFGSIE